MDKKSRVLVMGKLYFKNKDFKMAEKSFLEYLNSNSEDFQALKLLAQVYENLRNFSKAFELYERCYLAEPDRKGVLLDLCRLLLMNDTCLGHVDQRKWLKLAIHAFPSNPIVVNLRETLPAVETIAPNTSIDDEVIKKLSSMEQQLSSLQQNQSNLEKHFEQVVQQLRNINIALDKKDSSTSKSDKTASSKKSSSKSSHKADKASEQSKYDKPTITPIVEKHVSSPPKEDKSKAKFAVNVAPENYSVVEQKQSTTFSCFTPQQPTEIKPESPPKPTSFFSFESKFSSPHFQPITNNTPTLDSSPLMPKLFTNSLGSEPFAASLQPFAFSGPPTSNLFADGLKKNNLPTEGSWTSGLNNSFGQNNKENTGHDDDENDDANDDGGVKEVEELPIENTCDMKPVEIKSGEEDEDILFEQRCKLHRFKNSEYKERGVGQMKVLRHKDTGKGRLIMRREMINLVCLNCWSCSGLSRVRDNQVRFAGMDASDDEHGMTVFLAKFKTLELTDAFISHFNEIFPEE